MSKKKGWLDSLVWPVVGVLALLPAYFAVRSTLDHFTYRTCAFEKYPNILQAYGYITYTVVSITYFISIALALGCLAIAGQKVLRWNRKRVREAAVYKKHAPRAEPVPAPEPIPFRELDMDLQLKSPEYWFWILQSVLKFLRFWPAFLLMLVTSSVFVILFFGVASVGTGIGVGLLLKEELCLPALPCAVSGIATVIVGIWLTSLLNGFVMQRDEDRRDLSSRLWHRIFDTPPHVRKRLSWATAHYANTRFRYDTSNGLCQLPGVLSSDHTDNGSVLKLAGSKRPLRFTAQYDAKTRFLYLYVTRKGTERALALIRVQFPKRAISDMHLNELARHVFTEIPRIVSRSISASETL